MLTLENLATLIEARVKSSHRQFLRLPQDQSWFLHSCASDRDRPTFSAFSRRVSIASPLCGLQFQARSLLACEGRGDSDSGQVICHIAGIAGRRNNARWQFGNKPPAKKHQRRARDGRFRGIVMQTSFGWQR